MATAETKTYTPEDLLKMPDGDAYELVDGNLVEVNVSVLSCLVGGELFARMNQFCREHDSGKVLPADMGLQCFPDAPGKVRRADASFVRADRFSTISVDDGYLLIAPNLIVEVVSPNDTAYDVDVKVQEYLNAGVQLVWVINPITREAIIRRGDGSIGVVKENGELDGEDVLPGFRCPLRDLFPPAMADLPSRT